MEHELLSLSRDLNRLWPEVKCWLWPFTVNVNSSTRLDERNTMAPEFVTTLLSSKVVCEKMPRTAILNFFDLYCLTHWCEVDTRAVLAKEQLKTIEYFFCILLPTIISEIMTHFPKKWHFAKFDLQWHLQTSMLNWITFQCTHWEPLEVFYAFLYHCPSLSSNVSFKS